MLRIASFMTRTKAATLSNSLALYQRNTRYIHATRPVQQVLKAKTEHFAPESGLTPFPYQSIERDIREGKIPDFTVKNAENEEYILGNTTYISPVIELARPVYDPEDHSLSICPRFTYPIVPNLYKTKEDSFHGWKAATSSYFRDLRNTAEFNGIEEISFFGGGISDKPSLMYVDSQEVLPEIVAFENGNKPPLSVLGLLNDDVLRTLQDTIPTNEKKLETSIGDEAAAFAVALKARALDHEFLDIFGIDTSYRGFNAVWLLHVWLTYRWMRLRPNPTYSRFQEALFQLVLREEQIANRRMGNVSLKFTYFNMNAFQRETYDMFREFDKALQLSLAGDPHLWYHVLYHHIYRVAESRPPPATITFNPKSYTHFPVQIKNLPDRAQMNHLIQYIHNYLYTYAAMPLEDIVLAYSNLLTLPIFPRPLKDTELLGKITSEEADIFSRYIQHPSYEERGDEYTNRQTRNLLVALGSIPISSKIINQSQYESRIRAQSMVKNYNNEASGKSIHNEKN